jgi:hypothetical protein
MRLRIFFFAGLAIALTAFLSQATNARAGQINGSVALNGGGVAVDNLDLTAATSVTASSTVVLTTGLGDYSALPMLTPLGAFSLDLNNLSAFSITLASGASTYGTFGSVNLTDVVTRTSTFLDIYLKGVFTPGNGIPGTTSNDSSLVIQVSTNGSPGLTAILSSPPAALPGVPEPASLIMGLTSLAVGGLVYGLRRRSRTIAV